ncbi:MAG: hypothetical protein OEM28_02495 [Nitrosopumilus sp.]|nr:hypothetical protein [Nitrosopumilus sp.]MDH3486978.1 hypothetical protein [Nitrosopumilus sp.]
MKVSVSVIDGNSDTIIDTIPVLPGPVFIFVNPETNKVYVDFELVKIIAVIDGTTDLTTYCNDMTINQLILSGQYIPIDNRLGLLGNVLQGTIFNDLILASDAGNDISGRAGADCIIGGAGNDIINGNAGNDIIFGNDGSDRLIGGIGHDLILAGLGNDEISGGFGDDSMDGGLGNDNILGQPGNDFLAGRAGDDVMNGGIGTDTCISDVGDTTAPIRCEL